MVKKQNFLWFDKKILVLLIAFYIQNVTSFWGKQTFVKRKSLVFSRKRSRTNTFKKVYTRFIKRATEILALHNET